MKAYNLFVIFLCKINFIKNNHKEKKETVVSLSKDENNYDDIFNDEDFISLTNMSLESIKDELRDDNHEPEIMLSKLDGILTKKVSVISSKMRPSKISSPYRLLSFVVEEKKLSDIFSGKSKNILSDKRERGFIFSKEHAPVYSFLIVFFSLCTIVFLQKYIPDNTVNSDVTKSLILEHNNNPIIDYSIKSNVSFFHASNKPKLLTLEAIDGTETIIANSDRLVATQHLQFISSPSLLASNNLPSSEIKHVNFLKKSDNSEDKKLFLVSSRKGKYDLDSESHFNVGLDKKIDTENSTSNQLLITDNFESPNYEWKKTIIVTSGDTFEKLLNENGLTFYNKKLFDKLSNIDEGDELYLFGSTNAIHRVRRIIKDKTLSFTYDIKNGDIITKVEDTYKTSDIKLSVTIKESFYHSVLNNKLFINNIELAKKLVVMAEEDYGAIYDFNKIRKDSLVKMSITVLSSKIDNSLLDINNIEELYINSNENSKRNYAGAYKKFPSSYMKLNLKSFLKLSGNKVSNFCKLSLADR